MVGTASVLATLLDFNGVLIDDEHLHFACMAEVLAPLRITLTEKDYFGRYFALDDAGAFRAILADFRDTSEISAGEITTLVNAKIPVYLRRAETEATVFPGATELVRACAKEGPVAIVSGALRHEIEIALEKMGVRNDVMAIVSAEDTRACKPDPHGYLLGIEALATVTSRENALRAIAIEDSPGGVRAAKSAGIAVVAVLHSIAEEHLRAAGADHVVKTIGEVDVRLLSNIAARVHAST